MATFLAVHGTEKGQTAKTSERTGETIEDRTHDVTTVDVESSAGWDEVETSAADVGAFVEEWLDSDRLRPSDGNFDGWPIRYATFQSHSQPLRLAVDDR